MRGVFSKILRLFNRPFIKQSKLDRSVLVGSGSQIINSSIGYGSYLGNNVVSLFSEFGNFCSVGNNCTIGAAEHPQQFVSTSPVFYGGYRKAFSIKKICLGHLEWDSYKQRVEIGSDVWIGNNVIIKSGVRIGTGAIVAAGAVVTKDVLPYEVVGGVPAKHIKYRFEDPLVKKLLESCWWTLPIDELKRLSSSMDDPEAFLTRISEVGEHK